MWRHFLAVWTMHRRCFNYGGYSRKEQEDNLCALAFNVMGYLHEILATDYPGIQASRTNLKQKPLPVKEEAKVGKDVMPFIIYSPSSDGSVRLDKETWSNLIKYYINLIHNSSDPSSQPSEPHKAHKSQASPHLIESAAV